MSSKKTIASFFSALQFFTRIPCPEKWTGGDQNLNRTIRFLTLIGWIVGGAGALVFSLSHLLFPIPVSVALSMTATILLTGGFHEDGFSDVCDAFGGGWNRERILQIMKDSRIGAYGVLGLILILGTKFLALASLPVSMIPAVMVAGHALSRFSPALLTVTHEYARADQNSKSGAVANKTSFSDLFLAALFGFSPLILFMNWKILLALPPMAIAHLWLARYYNKWIGGYTGDCLGTCQQVGEMVFYLSLLAIWGPT